MMCPTRHPTKSTKGGGRWDMLSNKDKQLAKLVLSAILIISAHTCLLHHHMVVTAENQKYIIRSLAILVCVLLVRRILYAGI